MTSKLTDQRFEDCSIARARNRFDLIDIISVPLRDMEVALHNIDLVGKTFHDAV